MCMVTKINQVKQIWNVLNYKLDCEDTDAEKVLTQISNTNAISLSTDTFQGLDHIHPKNE